MSNAEYNPACYIDEEPLWHEKKLVIAEAEGILSGRSPTRQILHKLLGDDFGRNLARSVFLAGAPAALAHVQPGDELKPEARVYE